MAGLTTRCIPESCIKWWFTQCKQGIKQHSFLRLVALMRLVAYLTMQRAAAGYKLQMREVDRLLDQVDVGHTGHVAKGQLAASQIDWATLQADRDAWLRCVRRAFEEFDADHDGVCGLDEIVACLKAKLPLTEVSHRPPLHAAQAVCIAKV